MDNFPIRFKMTNDKNEIIGVAYGYMWTLKEDCLTLWIENKLGYIDYEACACKEKTHLFISDQYTKCHYVVKDGQWLHVNMNIVNDTKPGMNYYFEDRFEMDRMRDINNYMHENDDKPLIDFLKQCLDDLIKTQTPNHTLSKNAIYPSNQCRHCRMIGDKEVFKYIEINGDKEAYCIDCFAAQKFYFVPHYCNTCKNLLTLENTITHLTDYGYVLTCTDCTKK